MILLVWLISPIDLVPEFIPVLGPLDDVIVAVVVLRYVRRRLGDEEIRRRWPGTADGLRILDARSPVGAERAPLRVRRSRPRAPSPAGCRRAAGDGLGPVSARARRADDGISARSAARRR